MIVVRGRATPWPDGPARPGRHRARPTVTARPSHRVPSLPMTDAQRHLDHARELLRAHPVFDGHNDLPWAMRRAIGPNGDLDTYDITVGTPGHTDLPRLRAGGVGSQFWSVYVPVVNRTSETSYAARQLEQIDARAAADRRLSRRLRVRRTADEVEAAIAGGKIASLIGMEGGH